MSYEEKFQQLLIKIKSYHPNPNLEIIQKAYDLAVSAHGLQIRKSGEPYIIHPIEVALILADLELDIESIVGGILHDVIEDTKYTYDSISKLFSEDIAKIVDGVTKLDKLPYSDKEDMQAENYRKMFFAMAKDIRVILIKIADRLHNMRTLEFMPRKKQIEKAQETMDIYAPIAHKLGIFKIRYEMEDLAFKYLEPEEFKKIEDEIKFKQSERQEFISAITEEVSAKLKKSISNFNISGRSKHFYSIYKKMRSKNKQFYEINDLFAIRVLVDTIDDCYMVFGIVNNTFTPVNNRFKDYISSPKENKYRSLHNTLIGPGGNFFEIQIRTYEMHRVAENGVAAHWKYKQNSTSTKNDSSAWLQNILEIQKDIEDNHEFVTTIKGDLNPYADRVYCYTPAGAIINLVNGSTPIDFAYSIHTEVGNKMISAKVNGKIVPYDYILQNSDRVEILTSKNSLGPSLDWLKLVKTSSAKTKINQWFKSMNKEENVIKGKEIIDREIKKKGYVPSEVIYRGSETFVAEKYNFKDFNTLCAAVGHNGIKEGYVVNKLIECYKRDHHKEILEKDKLATLNEIKEKIIKKPDSKNYDAGVIIDGLGYTKASFAGCCHPIFGDDIVSFTTRGRGIIVHRTNCNNIKNLCEYDIPRVLDAHWPESTSKTYGCIIQVTATNYNGLILQVSKLLLDEKIQTENLSIRSHKETALINIELKVHSRDELDSIIKKLSNSRNIGEVTRL
ncbi:MAG: RelA/SpoT family protein [Lachnospirales bacterium]